MRRHLSSISIIAALSCVFDVGVTTVLAQAPHAAHQPRFGGLFAATASDTFHLEAVWSEQRRFRLFVMDGSGEPLSLEQLREVEAFAIAGDRESALTLLEVDHFFEARIPTLTMPASITVRVKVAPAAAEERVTFTFDGYSTEVIGVGRSSPVEIPETLPGIIGALSENRRELRAAIERGEVTALLGIEDRLRDLLLAVEPYLAALGPDARVSAASHLTRALRACWLLHIVMDYGDGPQRDAAIAQLDEAIDRAIAAVTGVTQ